MAFQEISFTGQALDTGFDGAQPLQFSSLFNDETNKIFLNSRKVADAGEYLNDLDIYDQDNDGIHDGYFVNPEYEKLLGVVDEGLQCSVDFLDENISDTLFELNNGNVRFDPAGNIIEFQYLDTLRRPIAAFTDITWSEDCKVISFRDNEGNAWSRMPADPNSSIDFVRAGDGWTSTGPNGQLLGDVRNLGNVKFDANGMNKEILHNFLADGF